MLSVQGPFMPLADAAEYCGYAVGTFERILREYDVPRHGPKKNRLAKSTLDAWMASPETFKRASPTRRRKPRAVTV